MKRNKLVLAALLFALGAPVFAEGPPQGSSGNTALDAARKECVEKAGKDSSGRPDMTKVDSCMKAKGYEKPAGPPSGSK